jgi:hypothetical protein
LEIERDDLKGFQILTKKATLQKQIDSKNEQIDILKTGLSGIAKRHGYKNGNSSTMVNKLTIYDL